MRNYINRKLGVIIIFVIVIAILINISTRKSPYELVEEMRDGTVDYELISSNKTDDGIFLYTSGIVNKHRDNIYYVDMVKKTLTGYKWVGGGGHINRDLPKESEESEDFIISMQLLNEEQHITPTALGIISDEKVIGISIDILDELSNKVTIYNGRDEKEKFYVVHFEGDIADVPYLIVRIMYAGDREVVFLSTDEDMKRLQEGKQLYINEENIEK
ncbi:MAG: hypothetical protein GX947_04855 [Tissierellia bacterium]|nr:hypothetical protein [Tissierellia bacterium]